MSDDTTAPVQAAAPQTVEQPGFTRRPRRRVAEEAPAAQQDDALPKRRRRKSVGTASLKLAAPMRPGFTRRWVNDQDNRIADAVELGYDHVSEQGIQSSSPDSRVSRLVGTKANGEPLRAFLMETPNELYAEGVDEKETHNRLVDEAIAAGRDSTGHMPRTNETYGRGSIQRDR
jgi:hypothetical protein